jgi:hypothetical protein
VSLQGAPNMPPPQAPENAREEIRPGDQVTKHADPPPPPKRALPVRATFLAKNPGLRNGVAPPTTLKPVLEAKFICLHDIAAPRNSSPCSRFTFAVQAALDLRQSMRGLISLWLHKEMYLLHISSPPELHTLMTSLF